MQNINKFIKKNVFSILKISFVILVVLFVVVSIIKEVKSVNLAETIILMRSFSNSSLVLLVLLGLIAVSSMTLYDFLIADYLKLEVKPMEVFNISYLACTINNISGLGGLTGASIRAMLLKKSANSKGDIIDYNLLLWAESLLHTI